MKESHSHTSDEVGHPLMVSVVDAAGLLGLGKTTVTALIGRGELASVKVGSRRLVPYVALQCYVEKLRRRKRSARVWRHLPGVPNPSIAIDPHG